MLTHTSCTNCNQIYQTKSNKTQSSSTFSSVNSALTSCSSDPLYSSNSFRSLCSNTRSFSLWTSLLLCNIWDHSPTGAKRVLFSRLAVSLARYIISRINLQGPFVDVASSNSFLKRILSCSESLSKALSSSHSPTWCCWSLLLILTLAHCIQRPSHVSALDHEGHCHPGLCTSYVSIPQAETELMAQGFLQPVIAIASSLRCDNCECYNVLRQTLCTLTYFKLLLI